MGGDWGNKTLQIAKTGRRQQLTYEIMKSVDRYNMTLITNRQTNQDVQ